MNAILSYFLKATAASVAVFLFLSFTSGAYAQDTPPASTGTDDFTCTNNLLDPQCNRGSDYSKAIQEGENRTAFVANAFMDGVYTIVHGLSGDQSTGTSTEEWPEQVNNRSTGLIGFTANTILGIYDNRDISGVQYLANLNPIAPAYATGTQTLQPIFELWKIFRNISYVFIVLGLITFGFMVMFRYQLDPRTVVTVSDALPRVIIALILITFSFAIPGLFMDAEKVLEGTISNSIGPLKASFAGAAINDDIVPQNARFREGSTPKYPADFRAGDVLTFQGFFTGIGSIFSNDTSPGFTLDPTKGLDQISGGIAQMVLNFALFSLLVQLVFGLVRYFASFFILTIFGPIAILWSVLPGQEETLTKWLSQLAVAALVFPVVYLLLNIAYFIRIYSLTNAAKTYFESTEFRSTVPTLVMNNATNISSFLILGILLITSKVPELIEEALRIAPKGKSAHAGLDLKGAAKKIPIVGGFV